MTAGLGSLVHVNPVLTLLQSELHPPLVVFLSSQLSIASIKIPSPQVISSQKPFLN